MFNKGLKNGSLKSLKEIGHAVAAWHTYQFYNYCSDFVAYEEPNLGRGMSEDDKNSA